MVNSVDDMATIYINWQSGSSLGVAYGEYVIKKVKVNMGIHQV